MSGMIQSVIRARTVLGASKRLQSTLSSAQQYDLIPKLPHLEKFKETGIPGLLSSKGLQNAIFDRLENPSVELIEDLIKTSLRPESVNLQTLIDQFAKVPEKSKIYNNASLIYNISFAIKSLGNLRDSNNQIPEKASLESLLETPDLSTFIPNKPNDELTKIFEQQFGSILEFKTLLLNSANAINGDGFVWVVSSNDIIPNDPTPIPSSSSTKTFNRLNIVNTYNSGSPFNNNKANQLTELKDSIQAKTLPKHERDSEKLDSRVLTVEQALQNKFNKIEYTPILAIDASPKNWLLDYGVFGKRKYLEQVWKAIDWDVVLQRLPDSKESIFH